MKKPNYAANAHVCNMVWYMYCQKMLILKVSNGLVFINGLWWYNLTSTETTLMFKP